MAGQNVATISERAASLAREGQVAQGYALLEAGIGQGDALAAATLAEWRLTGEFIRRDLKLARDFYGRAAELGLGAALPIYIAMLANGAGGTARDWPRALKLLRSAAAVDCVARRQLAVLDAMAIDDEGEPATQHPHVTISKAPPIERLPNFLTPLECDYLIECAGPLLQPSVVVDPGTGRLVQNPVRTSSAASFPFVLEDPVLHAINRRIAAATNSACDCGEPLQVLSYAPGQEYKLHSDALPLGNNQRVMTMLVYLNDAYDGGETCFPAIGLAHRGAPGDAILFANVDANGKPRADANHAGSPVTRGRKLLLSKWIRQRPLDLTGPPGRPY